MVGKSIWVIAVVLCLVCMSVAPNAHAQAVLCTITELLRTLKGPGGGS